jgi:hypothetical protein
VKPIRAPNRKPELNGAAVKKAKAFRLREWLTVPEATRYLTIAFGEDVTEADVLRAAIDGHLKLSVDFVNGTLAERGKLLTDQSGSPGPPSEPTAVSGPGVPLFSSRKKSRATSAWPDLREVPQSEGLGAVGTLTFEGERRLAATRMLGRDDVVIVGTDPMRLLSWSGADWIVEEFGPTPRERGGGLAVMSRIEDSLDVLYIDSAGVVQVSPWSRRKDFAPAWNQYDSDATVVLQSGTGHFVRAANGGGGGMGADGEVMGEWERLRMLECQTVIINAGETRRLVVFQTHSGHYVGAVGGGGSHVIAEAVQAGPWETFYLKPLPGFVTGVGPVTIGCINEAHYWSAVGGGGQALAADKSDPKEWEKFILLVVP